MIKDVDFKIAKRIARSNGLYCVDLVCSFCGSEGNFYSLLRASGDLNDCKFLIDDADKSLICLRCRVGKLIKKE